MSEVVKEEKKIRTQIWHIVDESRVVAFSDAVFAFAATLLVLKIDLPTGYTVDNFTTLSALIAQVWPSYIVNIISFLVIGYYWLNHHAIFGLLRKFDATLVWINLIFLIFLSFLPFPVDLHGQFPTVPSVVIFYSVSIAIVGCLQATLWIYASHNHRLISPTMPRNEMNYYVAQNLLAPVIFTVSIPLVMIHPLLAQCFWILLFVGAFFLKRLFGLKRMTELQKTVV